MPDGVRVRLDRAFREKTQELAMPALLAAAEIVEQGQQRRIPVSRDGSHGRPAGYAKSKIHIERGRDLLSPFYDIGTGSDALTPDGTNYPLILELGSVPHEIRSKGEYPLRNRKTGQVFGRVVQHPGTKAYPWLRAALADIAGRTLP